MTDADAPLLLPPPPPTPEPERERVLARLHQATRNALLDGLLPSRVTELVNGVLRQAPK
jgi:hypothetical protein